MTRRLEWPLLRTSALAHLAWRVYAARYEAQVAAMRESLTHATIDHDLQPGMTKDEIAARRAAYLDWWGELISFSSLISHSHGRLFFHFIQPNQYDRGAKPLSPEERERFTRETSWFDEVTPRYAYAKQMTEELHRNGIDSTFLGDLFKSTTETVYVDDCCHLNPRGVALLTDAVAQHIVASPEIARLRPAGATSERHLAGTALDAPTAAGCSPHRETPPPPVASLSATDHRS
jgi:hypothetical protein